MPLPAGTASAAPSLRIERRLLRAGARVVAGMDEVGRGALAGPVTVGVTIVDLATRSAPVGLRDSKLIPPATRERLAPRLRRWAVGYGVGHAEAGEIDEIGIIAALRTAAGRALEAAGIAVDVVLLDGSHDWFTPPQPDLFTAVQEPEQLPGTPSAEPTVVTMVKADRCCASVAAASVLAKTERDAIMTRLALAEPRYGWAENKGYAAPGHVTALTEHGPCELHRRSWRLPGVAPGGAPVGHHGTATNEGREQ